MSALPDVTLETVRLILRPPRLEDFDAWAASTADPEGMKFLGGPQPRPTAWRAFAGMAGSWALLGFGMFSVLEKSHRALGRACRADQARGVARAGSRLGGHH